MAKQYFRPWNVDAIAEVVGKNRAGDITVVYEHDKSRSFVIEKHAVSKVGRFVDRAEFRAGRVAA